MSRYDTLREAVVSDDFELFLETHLGIWNITANDADYNLLQFSIHHKQYKSVEWLLKNGADPEIRNSDGKTCIEDAMISFDPAMISIISKYTGFNINAYDKNGHTYVHQHICSGNLNLLSVFYNSKPDFIDFHKPTQYGLSTIDLLMCTLKSISDSNIRLNRIKFIESIYDKEEIFIFANKNNQPDPLTVLRCFNSFIYDIFHILIQHQKKNNNSHKMLIKIMNQPRNLEYISNKVSGYDFFSYLLITSDLTDKYMIDAITCLIHSGIFNIDNINDSGLNIFQFIIKNRPTLVGFLEHILSTSTLKSKVLNIFSICNEIGINTASTADDPIVDETDINADYKAFRRKIKSYVTKDVLLSFLSLSSNPSNIISTLNSMSFHWKKIINPGEIIPFKCCNLFVWALKNDIPLAKVFLEKDASSSSIDWNSFIMTNYCQSKNKTVPTGLPSVIPTGLPSVIPTGLPSVIPTGLPSVIPTGLPSVIPTGLSSVIPSESTIKYSKFSKDDTSCSSPFSIAHRGGSKFSSIRDLMLERLASNPVPFNPTEYFSITDINSSLFLQSLVEKGLVQLSHWIQASPSILIQNFPKSLWKCVSLQERLPINKLTISGKPISSIPPEDFVILSNCIVWDIRELYSFIKSNPSNSFDTNDTLIDPSFIGTVIDYDDLHMVPYYANPYSPDTPNFLNYYYKAQFLISFSPNDITLLRKWTNIMISSGPDFNRELATFLNNPLSLDIYKQTITARNKKNNIPSFPTDLDSAVIPIIVQLRESAFNHLLSWYIDLNDTQKKVFVSFFSIAISGIEPSSDTFFTCGIQLKRKLDTLTIDDLHLFNGIDQF
jgi:hypothetical protein